MVREQDWATTTQIKALLKTAVSARESHCPAAQMWW